MYVHTLPRTAAVALILFANIGTPNSSHVLLSGMYRSPGTEVGEINRKALRHLSRVMKIFFFKFYLFSVMSIPNVGLELATLRSRVPSSN